MKRKIMPKYGIKKKYFIFICQDCGDEWTRGFAAKKCDLCGGKLKRKKP